MTEEAFWRLIDLADREALADDEYAAIEPIVATLSSLELTVASTRSGEGNGTG